MEEIKINNVGERFVKSQFDFSVNLLKNSLNKGENTVISPISATFALAQTMNGAKLATLAQSNKLFHLTANQLNYFLKDYLENIDEINILNEKGQTQIANSMWFNDDEKRLKINDGFLAVLKSHYNSDIFKRTFENSLKDEINGWVNKKTSGKIDGVIDNIDENAVLYLINAMDFSAEWLNPYDKLFVSKGNFNNFDGSVSSVQFLKGKEHLYVENDFLHGFIKPYKGEKYMFFALTSKDESSVNEHIEGLTGENLQNILNNPQEEQVEVKMPKFDISYGKSLKEPLNKMGYIDGFKEDKANFSGMATSSRGNIFIGDIIQKNRVSVFERGTEAGCATCVMMMDRCALLRPVYITLDKPFLFGICKSDNMMPMFLGVINKL